MKQQTNECQTQYFDEESESLELDNTFKVSEEQTAPINQLPKQFIGGIKPNLTKEIIHDHFCQYGEIERVKLKTNKKTGLNKGFAFILFKIPTIIYEILKEKQVIQGRQIDCKLSFDAKYNEIDRLNCSQ